MFYSFSALAVLYICPLLQCILSCSHPLLVIYSFMLTSFPFCVCCKSCVRFLEFHFYFVLFAPSSHVLFRGQECLSVKPVFHFPIEQELSGYVVFWIWMLLHRASPLGSLIVPTFLYEVIIYVNGKLCLHLGHSNLFMFFGQNSLFV